MASLSILSMPNELLEHIWMSLSLDHVDICKLASVCTKFKDISDSNEVWKIKLHQRWPDLLEKYDRKEQNDWRAEYRCCFQFCQTVRQRVAAMSREFFQKDAVSNEGFNSFASMLQQHSHASKFIINELMAIIHNGNSHTNLTEKYYAEKALRFVQQLHLKKEWEHYLAQPPETQLLEKGAILIAQWCQPTEAITENGISDQLDAIAEQVRRELAVRHAEHPLCKVPELQDIQLNSTESCWSPQECRAILEILNQALYRQHGFHGNEEDYYDPQNSYINKVLQKKKGIPITMSILYISVARRLGVLCEPVNFPSHFLIKWKEHPHLSEPEQYTYIDVFNKGRFLTERECVQILELPIPALIERQSYNAIEPVKVFERMARNLLNIGRQQGQMGDGLMCLRNAVELFLVICPDDHDGKILLTRLYIHLNINLTEVLDILQHLAPNDMSGLTVSLTHTAEQMLLEEQRQATPAKIIPKIRSENPDVQFSVGMIMKHKRYHYTCVIYGWDQQCEASREWIIQMGVNNLPGKQYQPFYNVLVEDGSNRYAAQENLGWAPETKVITHPEVGKYFSEYCGTHYYPNAEKAEQYPDDITETQKYVEENH